MSKPIVFSPLAAVGTAVLVACGAFCFPAATSWRGRLSGTIIATSVGWAGGIIAFALPTVTSAAISSRTGIGVWVYEADGYPFLMSALGCAACALACSGAGRTSARTSKRNRPEARCEDDRERRGSGDRRGEAARAERMRRADGPEPGSDDD